MENSRILKQTVEYKTMKKRKLGRPMKRRHEAITGDKV
jgi:hypothetical protein